MTIIEHDIQKEILRWLKAQNIFCWRVPLGGVAQKNGRFYSKNPMTGHPDIACLIGGQYVAIEVKAPGKRNKTSEDQKE